MSLTPKCQTPCTIVKLVAIREIVTRFENITTSSDGGSWAVIDHLRVKRTMNVNTFRKRHPPLIKTIKKLTFVNFYLSI